MIITNHYERSPFCYFSFSLKKGKGKTVPLLN